jgi:hypothetical protein
MFNLPMKFIDIKPPKPRIKIVSSTNKLTKKKNNASGFYFFIIILLIVIFYLSYNNTHSSNYKNDQNYINSIDNLATEVSPSATLPEESTSSGIIITPNPIDTQQSNLINKESVAITILNGAGIPGIAQEIKNLLTSNGYNIESIGNANNFYTKSVIYHSPSNEQIAKDLQTILSDYPSDIQSNNQFADDTHITIVIGENI